MYRDFYQLTHDLFADTPDSALLFASPRHEAALQAIVHGINTRRGPMLVSGEAGVGKTVLLRGGLTRLAQPRCKTIYIPYSRLSFGDLLGRMCRACGGTVDTDDPVALVTQFRQVLAEEGAKGREVVLVIDEAHNLPEETWTQLPLLADLRTPTTSPHGAGGTARPGVYAKTTGLTTAQGTPGPALDPCSTDSPREHLIHATAAGKSAHAK